MGQINANLDDSIVRQFRDVIYTRKGLKKGDFKKSLEEAMLDYIQKYADSKSASEKAEMIKLLRMEER